MPTICQEAKAISFLILTPLLGRPENTLQMGQTPRPKSEY